MMGAKKMTRASYLAALLDSWEFVKSECEALGIDAIKMAEGTGIPRSTVRAYFNGSRSSPRIGQLNLMIEFILIEKGEWS